MRGLSILSTLSFRDISAQPIRLICLKSAVCFPPSFPSRLWKKTALLTPAVNCYSLLYFPFFHKQLFSLCLFLSIQKCFFVWKVAVCNSFFGQSESIVGDHYHAIGCSKSNLNRLCYSFSNVLKMKICFLWYWFCTHTKNGKVVTQKQHVHVFWSHS